MHAFVELGVKVGSRLVLIRLSRTTALRHGIVVHHCYKRARPANRGQPLQKIMAAVRTIRARLMRDRALHLFSMYY
jgi:hypothetical protein